MKRKTPVLCLLAAALVGLALLAGCGAKAQPVHITVVNRTTLPLADLRIKLVSEEDFGENRLETTLQEGETASIQLGQYTQAQLDGGCNLQFYDETGEPVYPEYDPDTVTLVESGNVFILAPPNLSVTLFVDSSYDPTVYDEKIAALYDLADDGRGDVIPQGGDFHEDAVNDFTAFAGIWLGEANNDYDSMEIDAEGSWTLYLCGEAVDSGSLRYEPEWEAVYAYSDLDDSGSRIAPLRAASFTPPLTAISTPAKGWSISGMPPAALPKAAKPPALTGAGIPAFSSGMSPSSRAFGTMTAICPPKPTLYLTAMAAGAITSAPPGPKARKWTAAPSPIPRTRRAPTTPIPLCTTACRTRSLNWTRMFSCGATRALTT